MFSPALPENHVMDKHQLSPSRPSALILRPLGSLERFFWLADQNRALHFALAAEVVGSTTLEGWRSALDAVQRRHPLLSVCIEPNADGAACFVDVPEERISLRACSGDEVCTGWKSELEQEMSLPFDSARAPLVRAALLHEAHRCVLILVLYHAIADGVSAIHVVRDLLRAMSGEPLVPLPVPAPHEEALGFGAETVDAALPALPAAAGSIPGRPATYRPDHGPSPRARTWLLNVEATNKLRTRARAEGTTVHGALAAALSMATRQLSSALDRGPVRVFSPIDTRKLLGIGDECVPAIGNTLLSLDPRDGSTFWELARQATEALAPARTLANLQAGRTRLRQALAGGADIRNVTNAFAYEILLTNLGSVPFGTCFGALVLERLWGPSLLGSFAGAQVIGVTTINGAMHLLQTSNTMMETLLETTEAHLAEACDKS